MIDAVRALLAEALSVYRDSPRAGTWLRDHLDRLDEPLRVAVTGRPGAGKSTLINVLVGADVAPVWDGLTWFQDGPAARVVLYPADGPPREVPLASCGSLPYDGGDVTVELPVRALRHTQLLDAPAAQADRVLREADVVLYLTRHLDETDRRFLRLARRGQVAAATPVAVLTVLSRADELAGGGIAALVEAKQLARRLRRDPVTHHVVALSPRLARAASTLTTAEHTALTEMAAVPRAALEPFLLSADRFGGAFPVPVDPAVRRALLDRLGLPGVRLGTTLVRTGAHTRDQLAAELARRSGLAELRASVRELFLERRDVLKARSALIALEFLLRAEPAPGAEYLRAELEHLLATAHDVEELRLLAALRSGRVTLPAPMSAEACHLAGAAGTGVVARLGLSHEPTDDEAWSRTTDALRRWRPATEDATLTAVQRRAAAVVVRTCETLLTTIGSAVASY